MFKHCVILLIFVKCIIGINILGFLVTTLISHQNFYLPILKELSLRGHNVTVISSNQINEKNLVNLTEFKTPFNLRLAEGFTTAMQVTSLFQKVFAANSFVRNSIIPVIESKQFIDLVNSVEFDLVIVEHCSPLAFVPAIKNKVPIIGMTSYSGFLNTHDSVGNPTHPVISPDFFLEVGFDLSFWERLQSSLFNIWYRLYYYFYEIPLCDEIARKHFGPDIPSLREIEENVSLLLINNNRWINHIRPNLPNVIEITQTHIKPKQNLPSYLQSFLDSAKNGVVYFSLGSTARCSNQPKEFIQIIKAGLSQLPYKVIWKWETDYMEDKPENVLLRKWLPQQDILGHPNVKAFITQAGLQSIEESIFNDVPMVVIPIFSDQKANAKRLTYLGLAKVLNFKTMTANELKDIVIEVAENKTYKENIMKINKLMQDEPLVGVEKAVWWIEYIIRNKGATHFKNRPKIPLYQYLLLDVIAFMCVCIFVFVISVYEICKLLLKKKKSKLE